MSIERSDYEAQGMATSPDGEYVDYKDHIASHAYDEAKERELFEAVIDYKFLSFLLPRDETGKYRAAWVDMAWLGWSECAKSRARSAE